MVKGLLTKKEADLACLGGEGLMSQNMLKNLKVQLFMLNSTHIVLMSSELQYFTSIVFVCLVLVF